jgi:hypothetical protein
MVREFQSSPRSAHGSHEARLPRRSDPLFPILRCDRQSVSGGPGHGAVTQNSNPIEWFGDLVPLFIQMGEVGPGQLTMEPARMLQQGRVSAPTNNFGSRLAAEPTNGHLACIDDAEGPQRGVALHSLILSRPVSVLIVFVCFSSFSVFVALDFHRVVRKRLQPISTHAPVFCSWSLPANRHRERNPGR